MNYFGTVPDVDREIISGLHGKDIFNVSKLNKYFYDLCSAKFWQSKFIQDYGFPLDNKDLYKAAYNAIYLLKFENVKWTAKTNYPTIINYLIHKDAKTETLIRVTLLSGNKETVQLLLKGANYIASYNKMLSLAAQYGRIELVDFFLRNGADIHYMDDEPLIMASVIGHVGTVDYLLDRGSPIGARKGECLPLAAVNGHLEVINLLLNKGLEVDVQNNHALIVAARSGHTKAVELLLDRGADISVNNDQPLKVAVEFGNADTVRLLLDRGANIESIDNWAWMERSKIHRATFEILSERSTKK